MARVNVEAPEARLPDLLKRVGQGEGAQRLADERNELLISAVSIWDRLLVAQAQGEAATLVTHAARLAAYDVPIMPVSG